MCLLEGAGAELVISSLDDCVLDRGDLTAPYRFVSLEDSE